MESMDSQGSLGKIMCRYSVVKHRGNLSIITNHTEHVLQSSSRSMSFDTSCKRAISIKEYAFTTLNASYPLVSGWPLWKTGWSLNLIQKGPSYVLSPEFKPLPSNKGPISFLFQPQILFFLLIGCDANKGFCSINRICHLHSMLNESTYTFFHLSFDLRECRRRLTGKRRVPP